MNIFPSVMHGRLQALHTFIVEFCESLEEIFEVQVPSCGRTGAIAVGQLREIHLCALPNLKHAWNLDAQAILFSENLRSVHVHYCYNLKFLFPASIAKGLGQLRELEIKSCSVEEIVAKEEKAAEIVPRFVFPQLTSLSLKELPGLKNFYPGTYLSEWPVLNKLEIYKCDKLKTFAAEYQNHCRSQQDIPIQQALFLVDKIEPPALENISSCFQDVTNLRMDGCCDLKYLFTASVAKCLVQLQFLGISNCSLMEGVIIMEKEMTREKLFRNLHQLTLKDLPTLKRFCNFTGYLIELFALTMLVIDNCPNMKTFVSNSICEVMARNEPEEMNSKDNLQAVTQPLFDEKVSLPNLEKLIVCKLDNLRKLWDNDRHNLDSFRKLVDLWVGYCNKLLNIFPSIMHEGLQSLEVLKVLNCDAIEDIFNLQVLSGQETNFVIATQLRELQLHYLPNLKHVCYMPNQLILGFQNLLSVEVQYSDDLESSCMMDEIVLKEQKLEEIARFMFPQLTLLILADLPRLKRFYSGIHISEWPMLKKLVVNECTEVEIVASEFLSLQENHEGSQHEISVQHPLFLVDKVAFPCLEKLELSKLSGLLHLWKGNSQPSQVFQNLATINVFECSTLTNIVPSSVSFHNLTTLEISKCEGLTSLVTSPTARSLMQLTRMDINDCELIEEIITVTDLDNEVKDEIGFKELEYLRLECLPSLRSFCFGNCTLDFPSLNQVIVRKSSKMETFSRGTLSTPKLQRIQLTEGEGEECWEGNLNTTIQQMFKEMNPQISTED